MRLALIGFMGAGKSSVAALLAQDLNLRVLELDQLLLESSAFNSIAELMDQQGENYFRDLESKTLLSALQQDQVILSTGGGVIVRPENINNLKAAGAKIIFLKASFEAILERLVNDSARPLFRDKAKALEIYQQRLALYQAAADLIIDTSNLSIAAVKDKILIELKSND